MLHIPQRRYAPCQCPQVNERSSVVHRVVLERDAYSCCHWSFQGLCRGEFCRVAWFTVGVPQSPRVQLRLRLSHPCACLTHMDVRNGCTCLSFQLHVRFRVCCLFVRSSRWRVVNWLPPHPPPWTLSGRAKVQLRSEVARATLWTCGVCFGKRVEFFQ